MQISLIRIDTLVKIRQSLGIKWRLGVTLTILLLVTAWHIMFTKEQLAIFIPSDNFFTILFVCFLILYFVAFFKKNGFARAFFALVSGFAGIGTLFTIPAIILPLKTYPVLLTACTMLLLTWFVWHSFLHYSYALALSLIRTGKYSTSYYQLIFTSRLTHPINKAEEKTIKKAISPAKIYFHFFIPGILAFAAGILSWLLVVLGLFQQDILFAIQSLNARALIQAIKKYHVNPIQFNNISSAFYLIFIPFLFGWFSFMTFSFIWHRWQRNQIPKDTSRSPEPTPAAFVLLLRSFKDDIMRVPSRRLSLRRLFFIPYEWSFTFEELIKKCTAWIGPLNAVGDPQKSLPPLGAPREYWNNNDWEKNIKPRIKEALVITVIVGPVKDKQWVSNGLVDVEMKEIDDQHYRYKTIFLMPPLVLKKNIKARWEKFVEYLTGEQHLIRKLMKINPSQVLAVCFNQKDIVIITGSWNHELFYESALDIAGIFANQHINSSKEKMIRTYLLHNRRRPLKKQDNF